MKLTARQAMVLVQTLRDTLPFSDGGGHFTFAGDQRTNIYNEILQQQDNVLIELDSPVKEHYEHE